MRRMKTQDEVNPRTWASIIRNCRSYNARHHDQYAQRAYAANMAHIHGIDQVPLWRAIEGGN